MMMLNYRNYRLFWSHGGPVEMRETAFRDSKEQGFDLCRGPGMDFDRAKVGEWQAKAMMFVDFNTLVVRDGVPIEDAHREFLKIPEYRATISPDTPGADFEPGEW